MREVRFTGVTLLADMFILLVVFCGVVLLVKWWAELGQ